MSPDTIAIISTGIALAALMIGLFSWLRADIRKLDARVTRLEVELRDRMATLEAELRERMAKLEGLLEGLREAITGRHAA